MSCCEDMLNRLYLWMVNLCNGSMFSLDEHEIDELNIRTYKKTDNNLDDKVPETCSIIIDEKKQNKTLDDENETKLIVQRNYRNVIEQLKKKIINEDEWEHLD
jgi:hypothetical protein